ncbi:hypothetical protein HDU85_003774 [Gaertneriomyces sp. JEL0708]|nr:hypothetical protein HDU85_003774 [Gaertneriomyces sp. JEL0708]
MDPRNWGKPSTNQWAPTPPASPPAWNNDLNSGSNGGYNGWNSNSQSRTPNDWNSGSDYVSRPISHQRTTSWSNTYHQRGRDDWDSVPGWTARHEPVSAPRGSAPQSTWNAAPAPPVRQPSQSALAHPPQDNWRQPTQSADRWAALPQHIPEPSRAPANSGSGWNPAGWDPLPPPHTVQPALSTAETIVSAGWNAKSTRPSVQQQPERSNYRFPPTPSERSVNFDQLASRGDRNHTGGIHDRRQQESGKVLRKAKSAFIDRRVFESDNTGLRNGRTEQRMKMHHNGGDKRFALSDGKTVKDMKEDKENYESRQDARRGLAKVPSRLFNRQMEEVNKSLGGVSAPKSPEGAKSTGKPQAQRRKKSARTLKDNATQGEQQKSHSKSPSSTNQSPSKATGLYIYNFPKWVRVREIIEIFAEYGDITNVGIVTKPKNDQRAYAYVDYEKAGCAANAQSAVRTKMVFKMTEPLEMVLHFEEKGEKEDESKSTGSHKEPLSGEDATKAVVEPALVAEDNGGAADLLTLHLGQLPLSLEKSELQTLFSAFGNIKRLHVVHRPRENRAYAFVSFRSAECAKEALDAVKAGRVSGLEGVKTDYARGGKGKRAPVDIPWKKGEALDGDSATKEKEGGAVRQPKKRLHRAARSAVHLPVISEGMIEALSVHGPIKSHLVLPKPTNPDTQYALVVFESAADAAKAVAAKTLNAAFPRQRRIHLSGLPNDITNDKLLELLNDCGEVQRADISLPEDKDGNASAVVEFVRGDGAAKAMVMCTDMLLSDTKIIARYAPARAAGAKSATSGTGVQKDGDDEKAEDDSESDSNSEDEAETDDVATPEAVNEGKVEEVAQVVDNINTAEADDVATLASAKVDKVEEIAQVVDNINTAEADDVATLESAKVDKVEETVQVVDNISIAEADDVAIVESVKDDKVEDTAQIVDSIIDDVVAAAITDGKKDVEEVLELQASLTDLASAPNSVVEGTMHETAEVTPLVIVNAVGQDQAVADAGPTPSESAKAVPVEAATSDGEAVMTTEALTEAAPVAISSASTAVKDKQD